MQYNGLGGRLKIIGWTGGISATTYYALDLPRNGAILTATTGSNTTFYFYGRGQSPVAELTTSWAYYLPDGTRTPRQLTDTSGNITLRRSYTPWGEVLEQSGTGNFVWGYFGGLMDASTGLIYVGAANIMTRPPDGS